MNLDVSRDVFINVVRAKGIEPSASAWEADVLPLYHARVVFILYLFGKPVSSIKQQ